MKKQVHQPTFKFVTLQLLFLNQPTTFVCDVIDGYSYEMSNYKDLADYPEHVNFIKNDCKFLSFTLKYRKKLNFNSF